MPFSAFRKKYHVEDTSIIVPKLHEFVQQFLHEHAGADKKKEAVSRA